MYLFYIHTSFFMICVKTFSKGVSLINPQKASKYFLRNLDLKLIVIDYVKKKKTKKKPKLSCITTTDFFAQNRLS